MLTEGKWAGEDGERFSSAERGWGLTGRGLGSNMTQRRRGEKQCGGGRARLLGSAESHNS